MEGFRYHAFISYSHADEGWARWLHRALETYRVPARLRRGAASGTPKRLFPVFRDRDELPSASELGAVIQTALRDSRALIVVCSPRAAGSRWVNEEIRYFKSLGRERRVFALIVDGEPHAADAARECFPPALCHALDERGLIGGQVVEPIAADARAGRDGRGDGLLKLVAGLLDVGFDELRQRERQRQFWRRVRIVAIGIAVTALLLGALQWFQRHEHARRLEQRIDRLYEDGRLALLEQQMARAAVYLAEAYKLGRDTPALRLMLSQALQSVEGLHQVDGNAQGFVRRPAFSPDDRQFVTPVIGEGGGHAVIWDTGSRRERLRLHGLPAMPHITRYLPDGERVLISGFAQSSNYSQQGAQTGIWDVRTGQRLLMLPGHSGHFGIPFADDGLHLLTADEPDFPGVRIRSVDSGRIVRALPHPTPARSASFSPDGRWVLTGDDAGQVRLWKVGLTVPPRLLLGSTTTAVIGILVTPDSRRAIAVSRKGDIRVWSLPDGELQLAFAADKSFVADLRMDANGDRLLTVGRQGYKVWDIQRGTLLLSRDAELDWFASGDLDGRGHTLAFATTDDARVELRDVSSRRAWSFLEFEPHAAAAALFSHGGASLLVAGETGGVALADPRPGPLLELAQMPSLYGAVFSFDGRRIATVGFDRTMRIWDAVSGAQLAVGEGHRDRVLEAVFSRDSSRIASVGADGDLRIWRATDAAPLGVASAHAAGVLKLIVSADGQRLATIPYPDSAGDFTAKLWSFDGPRSLGVLNHPAVVRDAAFSPDGKHLATVCDDGHLRIWDTRSKVRLVDRPLALSPLIVVAYSPGGERLLVLDDSEGAQLIDAESGTVLSRLVIPSGDAPVRAAVAPDGSQWAVGTELGNIWLQSKPDESWRLLRADGSRLIRLQYLAPGILLSANWDGSIRAWDSLRAQPLSILGGHDVGAWQLAAAPDGSRLISAGLDGFARVWSTAQDLPPHDAGLESALCRLPLSLQADDTLLSMPAGKCP